MGVADQEKGHVSPLALHIWENMTSWTIVTYTDDLYAPVWSEVALLH